LTGSAAVAVGTVIILPAAAATGALTPDLRTLAPWRMSFEDESQPSVAMKPAASSAFMPVSARTSVTADARSPAASNTLTRSESGASGVCWGAG